MSPNFKDRTGQKFGKLTVIKFVRSNKIKTFWLCKCDCGNEKIASGRDLKCGNTKSCGCLNKIQLDSLHALGHSKEARRKISVMRISKKLSVDDKNPNWKGDKVGYNALHAWIKRRKPITKLCENCNNCPPRDLANISQQYKRDINDFEWLCRKCHMVKDGRISSRV